MSGGAAAFAPPPPLALLHANYIDGAARKVAYLRSVGLWFLGGDEDTP